MIKLAREGRTSQGHAGLSLGRLLLSGELLTTREKDPNTSRDEMLKRTRGGILSEGGKFHMASLPRVLVTTYELMHYIYVPASYVSVLTAMRI